MKITFPGNKKVAAHYNGFTIMTDQPVRAGGDGTAPAPFDYFLSSLGTCSGIYVLSFCQARGIPVEDVSLSLDFSYNQQKRLIDKITITINVPDDFPPQYIEPLKRSAEFCAVSKHLYDPPTIEVTAQQNTAVTS